MVVFESQLKFPSFSTFSEELPLPQPNEIQKVRVTSAPYSIKSLSRTNVESKITIPRDLCDGEDVLIIKDNEKLGKLERSTSWKQENLAIQKCK